MKVLTIVGRAQEAFVSRCRSAIGGTAYARARTLGSADNDPSHSGSLAGLSSLLGPHAATIRDSVQHRGTRNAGFTKLPLAAFAGLAPDGVSDIALPEFKVTRADVTDSEVPC